MKALIWKEFRERWIWLALLAASTVPMLFWGISYTFLGDGGVFERIPALSGWVVISFILAIFMGSGTFSTELGGAAEFLFTRPVSWKRLLLAKMIVGIGIIGATALLTAAIFALAVDEAYARFVTLDGMAAGGAAAMLVMGAGYFVGLLCSPVLPGSISGVLVLGALSTVALLQMGISEYVFHRTQHQSSFAIPLGAIVAFILTARFGLTLDTPRRANRFVAVILVLFICAAPLDFAQERSPLLQLVGLDVLPGLRSHNPTSVGPGARFAIAPGPGGSGVCFARREGDEFRLLNRVSPKPGWFPPADTEAYWLDESTVYFLQNETSGGVTVHRNESVQARGPVTQHVRIWRLTENDAVLKTVEVMGLGTLAGLAPSPDRSRAVVHASPATRGFLYVVGIKASRNLGAVVKDVFADVWWWQSNDEIGYIQHGTGERRIVALPDTAVEDMQ